MKLRNSIFIVAVLFVAFFSFSQNTNAFSCAGSPPNCSQSGVPSGWCSVPACFDVLGCGGAPGCVGQWGCFEVQGSCGGGSGGGGGGGFGWNVSASASPSSGTVPLNGVSLTGTFNFSGLSVTITKLTYEFDCNGDGVFEQTYVQTSGFDNNSDSHTVSCNYPQSGHYLSKFRGTYDFSNGDHSSAVASTQVDVAPGNPNVQLSANPSSGVAPLNGVGLTATIANAADFKNYYSGSFSTRYYFDCGNGTTQFASVNDVPATYTYVNACNYASAGTYQPKVNVEVITSYDGIFSGSATANVTVSNPLPDLVISVPPSVNSGTLVAGQTLTFKATVKNQGNAAASGTFNNRFRVDANNDGIIDASDPDITPYSTITNLAAGASQQIISAGWTATAGTHGLYVCADRPPASPGAIAESDENNNCAWSGTTFTVANANQLPIGNHDGTDNASCTTWGWATDPDNTNIDLTVRLYSDGSLVKTVTAGQYRSDLTGVCSGGTCSFNTSLSGLISTGFTHSITATALDAQTGQEVNLNSTPKSITCPSLSYALTVTKSGAGSGAISSSPAGISMTCTPSCANGSASYSSGQVVTLTASPSAGSSFAGWSGDCSAGGSVTMNSDKTCTATFNIANYTLTVTKSGTGSGTVTSSPAGINCGAGCSASYASGQAVTLTATPSAGSSFAGWSNDCSGASSPTSVTMNANKTCTATFNAAVPPPNVFGYGWGGNPGDISAGIGWVSMSSLLCDTNSDGFVDVSSPACPPVGTAIPLYGVLVSSSGALSGYAWANPNDGAQNHIGWISFNAADVVGCPTAPCAPTLDRTNGHLTGWARAVTYDTSGGWDGWIRLWNDSNGNNVVNGDGVIDAAAPTDYGVRVTGCGWSGYAWGGNTDIGWIHFKNDANGNGIVNTENNGDYGVNGTGYACAAIGSIAVSAISNGFAWPSSGTASVNYSISGPTSIASLNSVPAAYANIADGSYSLTYISGGPAGATLASISPCGPGVNPCSQSISGGTPISFILNFNNPPLPPTSPSATTAPDNACKIINVSWTNSAGATGYNISRCAASCVPVAANWPSTPFHDTSASDGIAYTYQIFACNGFGCNPTPATTPSVTNNAPDVSFSYTPSSNIAINQLVQFAGRLIGGNATTSQSWTFSGGNPLSSVSPSPSSRFATAGSHTVTYTANNASGSCFVPGSVSVSQSTIGDWCEIPPDAPPGTVCP